MDNPKRWLVGKHQILKYDKETQTFFLNFELADAEAVEQAKAICERGYHESVRCSFTPSSLLHLATKQSYCTCCVTHCLEPDSPLFHRPRWFPNKFTGGKHIIDHRYPLKDVGVRRHCICGDGLAVSLKGKLKAWQCINFHSPCGFRYRTGVSISRPLLSNLCLKYD